MADIAISQRPRIVRDGWLRRYVLRLAERAARSYVAGPRLSDALALCRRLWDRGLATTVCFWNVKGDPPKIVAGQCIDAIREMHARSHEGYVSVKAPALGLDTELHQELLDAARAHDVHLHFDSHGPEDADATFSLIARCVEKYRHVGCTLPSRWRRSVRDADWAVERGLRVRVVKGEWDDSERSATDPRAGFQAIVERLAGRCVSVAIATHDLALARWSLDRLLAAGTDCELELLYGLPLAAAIRAAREIGVRARVYVPYGKAWLPYRISRIRENPELLWRLARDLLPATKVRGV